MEKLEIKRIGNPPMYYDINTDILIIDGVECSPHFITSLISQCRENNGQQIKLGWNTELDCPEFTTIYTEPQVIGNQSGLLK